jgi:hypothetical protein
MKATDRTTSQFLKLLYIGNSGTGKTGSLASLVEAGYNLRVLDMDNGMAALLHHLPTKYHDKVDSVTFRDKFVADPVKGLRLQGQPKAYVGALKSLNKWDDDSVPSEWGPDTILVLDSLTAFGRAAFHWAKGMNPTAKDGRQWYGTAQESIRTVLELLTDDDFHAHVIVVSHIQAVTNEDGALLYEQVSSIGKALGGDIPKYFNTMIAAGKRGSGENVKRTILTTPTHTLDLKIPAELEKTLPLETGMATIFSSLLANNTK